MVYRIAEAKPELTLNVECKPPLGAFAVAACLTLIMAAQSYIVGQPSDITLVGSGLGLAMSALAVGAWWRDRRTMQKKLAALNLGALDEAENIDFVEKYSDRRAEWFIWSKAIGLVAVYVMLNISLLINAPPAKRTPVSHGDKAYVGRN
jgi:hypothetical protein